MLNEDYMKHLANMDTNTLEHLMDHFGQDIWNFAYSLTKNRSMADDIAQDVFLQAFLNIASFRGEASVKTWLLRITRNVSYNYRKSAFFRRVLLVDVIRSRGQGNSAEQSYLEHEATNEVWRKLLSLPTKYREVLLLQAKYGLSLAEMAHILQIPEGTVKSRLYTARKKMFSLLKEDYCYETV
ncbi:RNA polymerase subunit sigma-70 [Paenibacillus yonginensis]|uniref:RNA polymerase sigma factor n=1 Tax=Paenibacillus yonginensis TaxID=1462996 RepID=A0A1B1N4B3_9BACL|nr:RNA polymerase sigma factor [Paenibacillus yonginensis]ANS76246.1 RNA polymerase subunit sigma-70 [Paenibacillus yonginensis]